MIKRILLLLTVAFVVAAMMVASALPAFASIITNDEANCKGEGTASYVTGNESAGDGRSHGTGTAQAAQHPDYNLGQDVSRGATTDCAITPPDEEEPPSGPL